MSAYVRPPRTPLSVSVTFPCYNEENNIERTTLSAIRTFDRVADDYEIIIVNDGSKDKTGEIADRLVREHDPVRVIHHPTNLGYGGALKTGLFAGTKPWVFYTDGDGQFDFDEIDKLLPLLEDYDIVSAYRLNRKDPFLRKVNAFGWTTLVNLVFGMRIRDIDGAFKIYPKALFDEIEVKSNSALVDAEVLARATRLGYTIGQVGVHHYPRTAGTQTGAKLSTIIQAFRELTALRKEIVRTSRH